MTKPQIPVALVLGARVRPDGTASPSLERRALMAAGLWHGGAVGVILASGGSAGGLPSEAKAIAGICKAQGVPESALLLEQHARTTEQNLRYALKLLRSRAGAEPLPQVTLVTDLYHQPRARLVARRLGLRCRSSWPPLRGARALPFAKAALREIPAFLWYWISGKGHTP